MDPHSRYRRENGQVCIDIRVRNSRQLFDNRDPAPFRDRDLDQDAVEYIVESAREQARDTALKLVLWISDEPEPRLEPALLEDAIRAHFASDRERVARRLRTFARRSQLLLLIGATILVLCLTGAELVGRAAASGQGRHWSAILAQGLVITGWVALWRPLESLLYDAWPLQRERRLLGRLASLPIEVHFAPGPPGLSAH